jgi:hypothetical protein
MDDELKSHLEFVRIVKEQRKQGFLWEMSVSEDAITRLISTLYPYKTNHDLIRLGADNDGGYLVPNDLENISACFSPGVDERATFENDLHEKFGIPSHLADYTSNLTGEQLHVSSLTKKYLGATDDEQHMTLHSWMNNVIPNVKNIQNDFLLQMDIEGNEYQVILALPESYLKKFRILIIEVHWLINWCKGSFYKVADAFMKKLLKDFYIVHTHINNGGSLMNIRGIEIPLVVEVTFIRKDRVNRIDPNFGLPHPLDMPNNKALADLTVPDWLQHPPKTSQNYFDVNSVRQF